MNPIVNLAFHLTANITHDDIGLQIACLILAIFFQINFSICRPTYEVYASAHTMYTFPKCPRECVKCIVCVRMCVCLSCKLSHRDADYRGISSAMQPRRQRTHYLFLSLSLPTCLCLFSSLSINAPWPMAASMQDQTCALYHTSILNVLSLKNRKTYIKETKNRHCPYSYYSNSLVH